MIDFNERLKKLEERRSWKPEITDSGIAYNASEQVRKSLLSEALQEGDGVKYVMNGMAPVDKQATEISKREGLRVFNSLQKSLEEQGETVIHRLQGSVPLDIHIKGHSDVDVLVLDSTTITVEKPEVANYVASPDHRVPVQILKDIRLKSEEILQKNFPATTVDTSGAKSIAVSGGSLQRKVDIVPAMWYDTLSYQKNNKEIYRDVNIYNKKDHSRLKNSPFYHMHLVNQKDSQYSGNLKCVIRLMKTVLADMDEDKKKIAKKLSSYDLTSIAFHMDQELDANYFMRLGLVEKTRAFLQTLYADGFYRNSLYVPDRSRKIFDTGEKDRALGLLLVEYTELTDAIYREMEPYSSIYNPDKILLKSVS